MRKTERVLLLPLLCCAAVVLSGCGRSNIFSWAHTSGSSGNAQSLASDGYAALQNKDYAKAIECYGKILESNPNNSEAIYGYSAAELANSGIDIASLVANLLKNQPSSAPIRDLKGAIAYAAARTVDPSNTLIPQTILDNPQQIQSVLDVIIPRLERIVRGQADGKILPDNADVNLNLAVCYLLHAALKVYDNVDFTNDYGVTWKSNPSPVDANIVAADIVNAFNCVVTVVETLHLASGSIIDEIKGNMRELFDNYKTVLQGKGISIDYSI